MFLSALLILIKNINDFIFYCYIMETMLIKSGNLKIMTEINTQKKLAAGLSITSNAVIILLKIAAGITSGSISIISEAIHSFSDFLASILTFFAVSRSSEPADKEHPFGHGKYEDMSGFIEGGLIVFAGFYIIYEAVNKLLFGFDLEIEPMLGIYVMAFAVIANFIVSGYLFYIAKKSDSVSLYADAQHLRSDVFSSLGVLTGLVLIKYTGIALLDPIIALIVAVIIIKAGYSIAKDTLNNLLDGSLPIEDVTKIENILKQNPSITGFKNLKARKVGHCKDIEITVFFNPDWKISQCHKVCDEIENAIEKELEEVTIVIHPEPDNIKLLSNR